MELVGGDSDIYALSMIPRPTLRMWEPEMDAQVLVEGDYIIPWLIIAVVPGCVLNGPVNALEVVKIVDLGD